MELATADPVIDQAVSSARGRYLYAIIDRHGDSDALNLTGLENAPVYAIGDGPIVAVVSDIPDKKIRPERRRLAAHHDVLRRLMAGHTVLPMSFGLIADGADSVMRILRLNEGVFHDQINRVRGKVEMGVRVTWDVPNIFEYILGIHPDLALYRDLIFKGGRTPTHDEKIELGRSFDRFLQSDREVCSERVMNLLEPCCAEIVVNKPRDERDVMNLACLVDRDRMKDFEAGVIAAARGFNQDFAFDFNGPWPPHNFVEVELRLS